MYLIPSSYESTPEKKARTSFCIYLAKGTLNHSQFLCEMLTVRTDNLATMKTF